MSEIVIYKDKDGRIELDVNLTDETLWLSQQQMADLFRTRRQAITKHLKIYLFRKSSARFQYVPFWNTLPQMGKLIGRNSTLWML